MNNEKAIRRLAGSVVLVSVLLTWLVNPWWLLLAVFVGANLIQSSFTGFCPAAILMRKCGGGRKSSSCRGSSS